MVCLLLSSAKEADEMSMIHRRKLMKTPSGVVLKNAGVSIYLPSTSTAARIFDSNGNLHDSAPQLYTDSDGYTDIYFDLDDYTEDQAFDIVCSPDAACVPTENEVRLSSVSLSTEWREVVGTGADGYFRDTFEGVLSEIDNKWEVRDGIGETSKDTVGGQAGSGLYVVGNNSGDDRRLMIHQESIPYDPSKLYRLRVRIKRDAGSNVCCLGVAGRNAADDAWVNINGVDSISSQHYIVASNANPGATFTEYTGYLKGTSSLGDGIAHSSPDDPAVLHEDCRYFRPLMYLNVGGPIAWKNNVTPWVDSIEPWQSFSSATGSGIFQVDEFSIDVIPEDADEIAESDTNFWAGDWRHSSDSTKIDGDLIFTGSITAPKITVDYLSALSADLGTITAGNITLDSSGFLRTFGKDNYADTTAGIFLGYDTDAYKLNIGDATNYLKWDGTDLIISGKVSTGNALDFDAGDMLLRSSANIKWYDSNDVLAGKTYTTASEMYFASETGYSLKLLGVSSLSLWGTGDVGINSSAGKVTIDANDYIQLNCTAQPQSAGGSNLGTASKYFGSVRSTTFSSYHSGTYKGRVFSDASGLWIDAVGVLGLQGSTAIYAYSNFAPSDDSKNLGATNLRWKEGHIVDVYADQAKFYSGGVYKGKISGSGSGVVYTGTAFFVNSVVANLNGGANLGGTGNRWAKAYVNAYYVGTTAGCNFNGPISNLIVIKGIVTAAS